MITGASILNQATADIVIDSGKIVELPSPGGRHFRSAGDRCRQADCVPGFVDLHTHLREPGREDAETVGLVLSCGRHSVFHDVPRWQYRTCRTRPELLNRCSLAKEAGWCEGCAPLAR